MRAHRLLLNELAPAGYASLQTTERYLRTCGLPRSLIGLVKLLISTLNDCRFCMAQHWAEAVRSGETEARLARVTSWQTETCFTPAERTALQWAQSLTFVAHTQAPDDHYQALLNHFTAENVVDLTILIGQTNMWNRLAIAMRYAPAPQR